LSFVANPFVVILDANVLFPFRIRDVLLTFAHEGLFRARFTEQIMAEWTQNLLELKPWVKDSIHSQVDMIVNIRRRPRSCSELALRWLPVPRQKVGHP
jgi:hypothetical protein